MRNKQWQTTRQRPLRVGELIRKILCEMLARGVLDEPKITGVHISINEVRIPSDLRVANVYASVLGSAKSKAPQIEVIIALLNAHVPRLRREMARQLHLKYTPDLVFRADTSLATRTHIDNLLNDAQVQHDITPIALHNDVEHDDALQN